MISADYCRLMARYNTWQNISLITAANGLNDQDRWADRGTFFKSIAATFNHLYWADALILERLRGNERPHDTITHSLTAPSDWRDFKSLRAARDSQISQWATSLKDMDLFGFIRWYPPDGSARVEMRTDICATQFFNHQTHHRGQIHAMLTAFGATPGPTDIWAMPQ